MYVLLCIYIYISNTVGGTNNFGQNQIEYTKLLLYYYIVL